MYHHGTDYWIKTMPSCLPGECLESRVLDHSTAVANIHVHFACQTDGEGDWQSLVNLVLPTCYLRAFGR
jgi:hypothetical protein